MVQIGTATTHRASNLKKVQYMFAQKNLALGQSAAAAAAANYIEDVFSTYLYTGTGSAQTITNGIDLSGKGGLVWLKSRVADSHYLVDTARGSNKVLYTNLTIAEETLTRFSSFNSNGFSLATTPSNPNVNGDNYASWTFREQAKFFDVVTYTGNGTAGRTVAHNLGSVPGCIIVKRTDTTGAWAVYHRSLANTEYMVLNTTAAKATGATYWNSTTPTSTEFSLGTATDVNANTGTYVAYLFAHDAGGFGATGSDNVITCGSFTSSGSGTATITLGYEPQWFLFKASSAIGDWQIIDNMRGWSMASQQILVPNSSAAESLNIRGNITSTGINITDAGATSTTFIYITIRRGPMKTPTSATTVFGLNARTGTGAIATVTGSTGVDDAVLIKNRGAAVGDLFAARLTGTDYLETSSTAAEVAAGTTILQANPWDVMDGVKVGTTSTITNASANTFINYLFSRAPGFFDVVCYTGNATSNRNITHNLGVAVELLIVKRRNVADEWTVRAPNTTGELYLSRTNAQASTFYYLGTSNATTFTLLSAGTQVNGSGSTYVAYLFATVAGVSKVGSYTGTGTTLQVDCGFTAGSRFVMIKRTDSTGDWYVWDSARGIVSGNDPYLLLNSTAAEVTNTDYVDTANSGFEISSTAPAAINANGGTFIFLAIA